MICFFADGYAYMSDLFRAFKSTRLGCRDSQPGITDILSFVSCFLAEISTFGNAVRSAVNNVPEGQSDSHWIDQVFLYLFSDTFLNS